MCATAPRRGSLPKLLCANLFSLADNLQLFAWSVAHAASRRRPVSRKLNVQCIYTEYWGLQVRLKAFASRPVPYTLVMGSAREKVCNKSKERKKSYLFGFWKKTLKRKKYYSFKGHLITPAFNTQLSLPKVSTVKSPTSNILLRNLDTKNYAT